MRHRDDRTGHVVDQRKSAVVGGDAHPDEDVIDHPL